jgi:hypothetical protein
MTGIALSMIGAACKLSTVRIGTMAVCALLERDWLLEVAAGMTLCTADCGMLAKQRILRLIVIESSIERRGQDALPDGGVVASLTARAEGTAVRVPVAGLTPIKRNSLPPRLLIHSDRMALLTIDFRVSARQCKSGSRVIEAEEFLPICRVMALLAVFP